MKPSSWCLLKTIERFVEKAHMILVCKGLQSLEVVLNTLFLLGHHVKTRFGHQVFGEAIVL